MSSSEDRYPKKVITYGKIELMIFFVECGNKFTLDFGDIDEGFYDALNQMYQRAIRSVLSLPEEQRSEFQERLEKIMTSSSGIGWGYHDMLVELIEIQKQAKALP